MNAKKVLSRIAEFLSSQEVELTYAKLKDGTIVESATFDVGEDLFVIGEDGSKTPAPDGEHEISLRDTEGNEVLIKVISKDGKIVERENVELADAETVKAEPLPQADGAEPVEDIQMAEQTDYVEGDIPQTGDGVPAEIEKEGPEIEISLGEIVEKLQYRMEELEKKIQSMEAVKEEVVDKEADIEEELPKLDGAPIESGVKMSSTKSNFGKKVMSAQESVLAKLYK